MSTDLPDLAIRGRGATLGDQVYDRLREALLSGALSPGQRLNTRALASSLNVSLTPTRDGLARLISEGVLELGPNRVVSVPVLTPHAIAEVFDLRALLEGSLAAAALQKIKDRDIDLLEIIQADVLRSLDRHDYKDVMRQNFRFHFALYSIAAMPLAFHFVENLWLRAGPGLNLIYPQFDTNRAGVWHHNSILSSLRARDGEALKAAVNGDIKGAREEILRVSAHQAENPGNANKIALSKVVEPVV